MSCLATQETRGCEKHYCKLLPWVFDWRYTIAAPHSTSTTVDQSLESGNNNNNDKEKGLLEALPTAHQETARSQLPNPSPSHFWPHNICMGSTFERLRASLHDQRCCPSSSVAQEFPSDTSWTTRSLVALSRASWCKYSSWGRPGSERQCRIDS